MKRWKIFLMFIIGFGVGFLCGWFWPSFDFHETDLTCVDGTRPDANGCCAGEVYTDMGDLGFNCCPQNGGDCFPPIK